MAGIRGQIAFMKTDLKFMTFDRILSMETSFSFLCFIAFTSSFPIMDIYFTNQYISHLSLFEFGIESVAVKENLPYWHKV